MRGTTSPTPSTSLWVGEAVRALGHMGPVDTRALGAVLLGWVRDEPQRGGTEPAPAAGEAAERQMGTPPGA